VRTCLPVIRNRRTDRDAAFGKLVDELCGADAASIPDGPCVDLLVWHHLSWLGERFAAVIATPPISRWRTGAACSI
jgi:hypothetical protein